MNPAKIIAATIRYIAPKNWDSAKDGECGDLWVRLEQDRRVAASAWKPTPEELALLVQGHSVVLRIWGAQPVVSLSVEAQEIRLASLEQADLSRLIVPMLVIYARPVDYPEEFVVRVWDGAAGPTNLFWIAETLEEARAAIPARFKVLARSESDDPVIVESYV